MNSTLELSNIIHIEDLPSPPSVAAKILDLYSDANSDTAELERVISADPILSARVMTYANSPTVNTANEITTIRDAIDILGTRIIKTIALSFSLTTPTASKALENFDLDAFWNGSMVRAVAAKVLCQRFSFDQEHGFLSGLMMEIGELAVAFSNQTKDEILAAYPELHTDRPFALCHGSDPFDYYQFGGLLLREWKFPIEVIENVSTICSNIRPNEFQRTLMLAAGIGRMIFDDSYEYHQICQIKEFASKRLRIANNLFEEIFAQTLDAWIGDSMMLQMDSELSIQEIESEAKKQISSLSLNLHQENTLIAEENEMLRGQALEDQLTGLSNRRAWEQSSVQEWSRAQRSQEPFTLMVIDIDHFKNVNDIHGHTVGDMVLVHVATLLRTNVRKYDQVFRFGGEEFTIMLPNCSQETAEAIAVRLLQVVESTPVSFAGKTINVTVSAGVALWDPSTHSTIEALFEAADEELYRAKNSGRNQFFIFNSKA